MKKLYIAPEMEEVKIQDMTLLESSGITSDGDATDIGYGGWDTSGSWDPQ